EAQCLDAGGIDLDPRHGAGPTGQLDGQRTQTWTNLNDAVRRRELEGFDDLLQLPPVGEEVLPPTPLVAYPEATGHPPDHRGIGQVPGAFASRRGSTERARWRSGRSRRRSPSPSRRGAARSAP